MTNGSSVLDALGVADRLDAAIWDNLIVKRDRMEVLSSGRLEPRDQVDLSQVEKILHFARRSYSIICLDLSGNMEPFSMGLLGQSKEIFLVCTSDVPSLHLARAKANFLRDAGFGSNTSVVINRSETRNLFTVGEIEKLLGLRVRFTLQNDPRGVSNAMHAGTAVDPKSGLGRQLGAFADNILGAETSPPPAAPKRRFIEYFAIVPSDFQAAAKKRL
jgi:Flp pilus assembly CpaE family ATPase